MKRWLPLFLLFAFLQTSFAQSTGGREVYQFLNLSPSARVTALGGNLITVRDDDINLAFANPGLLNPSMHHQISFNHNFHLADIQHGYVAFGQYVPAWNTTLHAGLQYITYGTFDATNVVGEKEGEFKAAEYALTLGAGHELYERLSVGANLKLISSQIEGYDSYGLAADLAGVFHDTARQFTATLLFKHIGGQLTTYRPGNREDIPFEIQFGISKRLRYLPFRFSIIYRDLQRWNVLYDDPNSVEDVLFGEVTTDGGNQFFDNLFRHFVFNGEFLFGRRENFRLRAGYSHLLRQDLSVENYRSITGFSFGFGIKINRFRIDYGWGKQHLAGGLNHFTISTNFREFGAGRLTN